MIQLPIARLATSLLLPAILLGACQKSEARSPKASAPDKVAPAKQAQSPKRLVLPAHALSESDSILLEMADNACKARAYRSLFAAVARSKTVRDKYSADKIEYGVLSPQGEIISRRVYDKSAYRDFPITLVDYNYKPAVPLRPGDDDEYLDIQINQSQSDEISVEWARIHYVGEPVGEAPGEPVDINGKRLEKGAHPVAEGQLIFRPTADCWQLTDDHRWMRTKW